MSNPSPPPGGAPAHPPSPRAQRAAAAAALTAAPTSGPPPPRRRLSDGRRTALLFGIAFVIACVLYWPAMERKMNLPDALYGLPLLVAAATAAIDAWLTRRPLSRSLWLGAAVLPAAVFARVVHDVTRDPTSHNLWPFELAIAIGVGFPAALAGALLGWGVLRLTRRGEAA